MRRRTSTASRTTSKPATSASPVVGNRSVVRILMKVVFPAPLGPRSPKISPRSIRVSTPASACTSPPPREARKVRLRLRATTAGSLEDAWEAMGGRRLGKPRGRCQSTGDPVVARRAGRGARRERAKGRWGALERRPAALGGLFSFLTGGERTLSLGYATSLA